MLELLLWSICGFIGVISSLVTTASDLGVGGLVLGRGLFLMLSFMCSFSVSLCCLFYLGGFSILHSAFSFFVSHWKSKSQVLIIKCASVHLLAKWWYYTSNCSCYLLLRELGWTFSVFSSVFLIFLLSFYG